MRLSRLLAALAVLLFPASAWALSCPSIPITFVTNTTIQAPDFNTDFTSLYNCFAGALAGYTGVTSGGTANAQTVTYSPAPSAYVTGALYSFIVGSGLTNTGATTLNVNGLGAKNIYIGALPLAGGELQAGTVAAVFYDGTEFQLLSSPGARTPAPNILLNGALDLDQANEGAAVNFTNATSYGPDGWVAGSVTAASGVRMQRVAWTGTPAVPASLQFSYAVEVTIGTGNPTINSGDQISISNLVEGDDLASSAEGTAAARPLALSFCLESNIANAIVPVGLRSSSDTQAFRIYFASVALGAANTPTCTSLIIPPDTSGTWSLAGNAARGADVIFGLESGSGEIAGAANTWETPGNPTVDGLSGMTQFSTVTGATLIITGLKLEVSPVPTPFVRLPFAAELARAERYYQKSYDEGTAPGTPNAAGAFDDITINATANGNFTVQSIPLHQRMRCDPTVTLYSPTSGASGKISLNGSDSAAAAALPSQTSISSIQNLSGSTWSAGTPYNVQWTADCRL